MLAFGAIERDIYKSIIVEENMKLAAALGIAKSQYFSVAYMKVSGPPFRQPSKQKRFGVQVLIAEISRKYTPACILRHRARQHHHRQFIKQHAESEIKASCQRRSARRQR